MTGKEEPSGGRSQASDRRIEGDGFEGSLVALGMGEDPRAGLLGPIFVPGGELLRGIAFQRLPAVVANDSMLFAHYRFLERRLP